MTRFPLRRIAWLAAACALAAGCGSLLDPRPDETRFYVLDPTAAPEPAEETLASDGASIGLGPVRIPDYLRRPEIVTRTGASQIEPSATDRWGEPLEQAVSRVLTKELARALHTPRVVAYPWYRRTRPDYQVSIDVLQFERDEPQDRVVLVARWDVRALRGEDVHLYRESRLTADSRGDGTPDVVAALHAVLVDFSAELAKGVQELKALPPQPAITSEDLPPPR
jgi:uncharacterized lipoprotein YmbA